MSDRKPPAFADWLLNRSGFARQNPPLAGDLLEEFQSGRSAAWYWRQTLLAISTGLARNASAPAPFERSSHRLGGRSRRLLLSFGGWGAELPAALAPLLLDDCGDCVGGVLPGYASREGLGGLYVPVVPHARCGVLRSISLLVGYVARDFVLAQAVFLLSGVKGALKRSGTPQ